MASSSAESTAAPTSTTVCERRRDVWARPASSAEGGGSNPDERHPSSHHLGRPVALVAPMELERAAQGQAAALQLLGLVRVGKEHVHRGDALLGAEITGGG